MYPSRASREDVVHFHLLVIAASDICCCRPSEIKYKIWTHNYLPVEAVNPELNWSVVVLVF